MEEHPEVFMGSLEAGLITFTHILLSRAQSRGPTEVQGSLGNVIFLQSETEVTSLC